MLTEKDTIKCESQFNEERSHRFLWKRIWNKDKPLVCVIMLNPSISDNIITDTTTTLVVNNIARLETYGGVEIVNLYSILTNKLNFRWNSDEDLNEESNDHYIMKAVEETEITILAWGKAGQKHPRIDARAKSVLSILEKYREKFYWICDETRKGLHPLTPTLHNQWILKPYDDVCETDDSREGSTAEKEDSSPDANES